MRLIAIQEQQKLKEKMFSQTIPSEQPILYVMAGIPASGKTTFLKIQKEQCNLPEAHYYHDPDLIMENIEGYQQDLPRLGSENAKKLWEQPARTFTDKTLFPHAVKNRVNIVMDMGMCRSEILQMVKTCQDQNYTISMRVIYCNLEEAIKRSKGRKRFVAESTIMERAVFFVQELEQILYLSKDIKAFNNTNLNNPFTPISLCELKKQVQTEYAKKPCYQK